MTVSGIAGKSAFDPSQFAASLVKKFDTNNDGSLDKNEFVQGLAAKGVSATDAAQRFDRIDSQKKGKITASDIATDIKSQAPKGPPPGAPAGPPPAGAAKGAGSASAAVSTTDTKTYDKADTNKDGTVSSVEALLYQIKHPDDSSGNKTSSSTPGQNVDTKV